MDMRRPVLIFEFVRAVCLFLALIVGEGYLAQAVHSQEIYSQRFNFQPIDSRYLDSQALDSQDRESQQRNSQEESGSIASTAGASVAASGGAMNAEDATKSHDAVPPGTILPVRLNSTISSAKSRPGQEITGRIMQDVPLPAGVTIRAGTKVAGHIVEGVPASGGAPARVTLQFDKLILPHQIVPMITSLRAIAGFMQIAEAQLPPGGVGESDVAEWLTTVQIGGDVVYGEGGTVTSGGNPNQIVGKKVNDGVLGQVRAKEGTMCRGAIDGNDNLQALWVFSTDACGTYGLDQIGIAHAGRSEPLGVIVLTTERGNFKIAGGTGMLLRVNRSSGE